MSIKQVEQFHRIYGCHINEEPGFPELDQGDLVILGAYAEELSSLGKRLKVAAAAANFRGRPGLGLLLIRLQLLTEEVGELAQAMSDRDMVECLDALGDIGYVTDGSYLTLGLQDLKHDAERIIHEANMSKLDDDGRPIISDAGRVIKGPNYVSPKKGLKKLLGQ